MHLILITVFLLFALPASAADIAISDEELNSSIELGEEIEGRADADLNGDGKIDTAYVVGSPDYRTLNVLITTGEDTKYGHSLEGSFKLPVDRLGPASLSIDKNVLKVEDLTGGTTAMSTVYRYRWDAKRYRMRLIGLDATMYSRTYEHDGWEMSWNLLTHQMVTADLRLNKGEGDLAYDKMFEQKFKWLSNPIYMEDTPDPEMVMIDVRKK